MLQQQFPELQDIDGRIRELKKEMNKYQKVKKLENFLQNVDSIALDNKLKSLRQQAKDIAEK